MSEQEQEQIKEAVYKLRMEKGLTMREISRETGVSLGKVAEYLKGIPPARTEAPAPEKRPPQFMPMLISKEHVAKLYALAMDEGYDDVNNWLKEKLLPWYAVKRGLEWKLHSKIEPKEFETSFEIFLLDSMELKELKAKLGQMSTPSTTVTPPSPTGIPNKGERTP